MSTSRLTSAPTRGCARLSTEVRRFSPVAVGRAVSCHYLLHLDTYVDAVDKPAVSLFLWVDM